MCRRPTILKSQRYLRPEGGRESVRNMKQFVLKGGGGGGGEVDGINEPTTTGTTMTDYDEAEIRYHQSRRKNKKTPKPPITMASIQIDFVIQLRKNKPLMKNWFTCQKFINMGEKQMKNMIMSLALVMHAGSSFAGNNTRTKELGSGLSQILALIVVPFIIPPGVVIGIPTIIVFLPIILLIWAFVTLNRRANKILWSRRNQTTSRRQRQSVLGQRVSMAMKQATAQLSFRTTTTSNKNTKKKKKKQDLSSNNSSTNNNNKKNTSWRSLGRRGNNRRSSSNSSTNTTTAAAAADTRPTASSPPSEGDDTASISGDDSYGPSCAYPSTSDVSSRRHHHNKAAASGTPTIFPRSKRFFKNNNKPKTTTSSSSSRTTMAAPVVPPRSKTWTSSLSSFITTSNNNNNKPSTTNKSKLRSKSWPSFGRSSKKSS